jgi:hypothetical protein
VQHSARAAAAAAAAVLVGVLHPVLHFTQLTAPRRRGDTVGVLVVCGCCDVAWRDQANMDLFALSALSVLNGAGWRGLVPLGPGDGHVRQLVKHASRYEGKKSRRIIEFRCDQFDTHIDLDSFRPKPLQTVSLCAVIDKLNCSERRGDVIWFNTLRSSLPGQQAAASAGQRAAALDSSQEEGEAPSPPDYVNPDVSYMTKHLGYELLVMPVELKVRAARLAAAAREGCAAPI